MERNAEYTALKEELIRTPDELDFTLTRAKARLAQRKRLRLITVPARVLLALAVLFTLLVNTSQSFALALSRVPVVSDLAAAVAFSPTLKMAVENGYMQYIGQEQSKNGVTVRIQYVVVVQRQLHIFYTVEGEGEGRYWAPASFKAADGSYLKNLYRAGQSWDKDAPAGALRKMYVDFGENEIPGSMNVLFEAYRSTFTGPRKNIQVDKLLAEFTFPLTFDPGLVQKGEVYTLDTPFTLDGQTFTVKTVEVGPMGLCVNLEADPANTKWIRALRCYAEDENGNRYGVVKDGVSATESPDTPMRNGFRLSSSNFGSGKRLTLYITGAIWLDKDAQRAKIDMYAGTAENLPDGVTFLGVRWTTGAMSGGQMRMERVLRFLVSDAFTSGYRDPYGTDDAAFEMGYGLSDTDEAARERIFDGFMREPQETQEEGYIVGDSSLRVVYLTPTRTGDFDAAEPIVIKVK